MSSRDLEVGLTVRWKDQASAPAQQTERNVQRVVRETGQTYVDSSRVAITSSRALYSLRIGESARAEQTVRNDVKNTEGAYLNADRNILNSSRRLSQAREQLGVRTDQAIRREIDQNVAAYNRLYRAGFASANEQARAFRTLTARLAELNKELRNVEQIEGRLARSGRTMANVWRAGSAVAGGVAGAMVVAPAVRETMAYDRRLAMMANTAFSDRDVAGRRTGMRELDNAIVTAVRKGGGTREQAADTLDNLLASGAVSDKTAMQLLPTLQKFATATGADPNQLGNIAIRAMQNFNIKEADIPKALDMALKGGQAGGFELRDMSKWLPQQMALAKTAGMSGLKDFGNLVVANQAAVITAGTKDEAGNNVVNLLEKLNSADTQIKAKKLGIDMTGSLASSREKGVNALDAFVGIVENVMSKDKRYQQNRAKLAKAPEGERKEILESQASLLEGTSIGKLIHDRQALGGLVAYMGQKDYRQQVAAQVFDPKTAVDGNFDLITGTASFKAEQLGNESAIAKQGALAGLNDSIGDASTKLTEYARKYPDLAVAIEGTTLGLKAATASLGVFAAAALLRGGVGAAGGAGAASGGAAAAGVLGAGASFGARFATIGKAVGRIGAPLAVAAGGLEAYMIANDNSKTTDEKKAGYVGVAGGVVGGLGGMAAGAAAGAAVGSVVPGLGTAVGLVGGAIAGYFGREWGEKLGKSVGDAIFAHKKDDKPPVVESHVSLYLDGEQLANVLAVSGQKEARRN